MKINCNRTELADAIIIAQKAVDNKNTVRLLEYILFEAKDDILTLTSYNNEMGIVTTCSAFVEESGSVLIDSKIICEIVKKLPDQYVSIDVNDKFDIFIESGAAQFTIKGFSSEGFPELPIINEGEYVEIPENELKKIIRQTIFAVSTDENRKILTGVLFESDDTGLVVVAIDGVRMALRRYEMENVNRNFTAVIPGKTLSEISKILTDTDENVRIMVYKNQILFSLGSTIVVSRILEGKFLNYKNLAISNYQTKITLSTKTLCSGLERAVLLYSDERKYSIKFDIKTESVELTANSENGYIREEIKMELDGKKMVISFNPKLLYEIIRIIDEETIELCMCSNLGPCTIKQIGKNEFIYTIAAVRNG